MSQLSERVEAAMQRTGIKARTFAALVGCHYTTIYDLLRDPEVVPLRVIQENMYDALDFLESALDKKALPLADKGTVAQKTIEIEQMFLEYKNNKHIEQ